MVAGSRDQWFAAREGHELRHPHAADHGGLDPFDRQHPRAGAEPLRAAADAVHSGTKTGDQLGGRAGASDRLRHPADISPDVCQPGGVQVDDGDVLPGEASDSAADVAQ